jgi:DNA-binding response OmpR family regulator
MNAKILLIEGKRVESPSFVTSLTRKGYQVECVSSGSEALTRLKEIAPDLIIIDSASMRTSGRRICQSIRAKVRGVPILLITEANNNDHLEKEDLVNVVLPLPFTPQKLLNRIRPLLPVNTKDLIQAGSLQLDPVRRSVHIGKRQTSLTPRLVTLLKILMEHPGEVVERELLFRTVWDTAYTEDTRTLDVHISWLRQAIEDDPRKPRLIKTIRGVGYRLDVEETP